jgi:hypothetical protein
MDIGFDRLVRPGAMAAEYGAPPCPTKGVHHGSNRANPVTLEELTLELLNQVTAAWVEQEYHRTVHAELGVTPLARYLAGPDLGRECPNSEARRAAFRLQVTRKRRISNGTLSLEGRRFELPARYRHLEHVCVRYARWDLGRVDLVDPDNGTLVCPLYPLDKSANASGVRRSLGPQWHYFKEIATEIG